jgi:hypothetical protein
MSDKINRPPGRIRYFRNWISLTGLVIAVASFFSFLLLFAVDLFANHANPYMGILAYVVAPTFLILGIGLIIAGYVMQGRRERRAIPGAAPALSLNIDLSRPRDRKIFMFFAAGSTVFLFLSALGSYQTYHITESVQFCGQTCHTPMNPEFVTYQHSSHARVECAACHVGPGATAYVKTKVNGVRQLYHAVLGDFERPIRLRPPHQRPAQETCEQCHWSQKYTGPIERTYNHFLADEKNTPFSVRMVLNVGGGDPVRGPVSGIHWHMNVGNKIEYVSTDAERGTIPLVRFTDASGKVTEYRSPDYKEGETTKLPAHQMDCMDCHNRPSHKFRSPNNALDLALSTGRIDPAIPWIKSKAVKALVQPYATDAEAHEKIAAFLRKEYPSLPKLDALITEVQSIYSQNFFPEMKADWRTYPEFTGHKDSVGCFRCHDGNHKSTDGKTSIKASDCTSCHVIIAQGSPQDMLKLDAKGLNFMHIDSEYSDFDCSKCHTGKNQDDEAK